jgi:hypothetical protein
MSSDQWEALMAEVDVDQTAVIQSSCRALTTNEDDDELLLQQVTDQIILVRDEEAYNVANLAAAHAADFMQPVENPLAVICTAAAGRSVLDQFNRNHLVTPGAAATAYNIHSPYIQFMTQMHPAAASMMQQMQNPIMISSAATVQSSGEDSVEDHESDEELFLVRPQSHHGHQQQQQLMNYVPQQRRPYEAVLPAADAAETTTASDQLQEEEEEASVQQQRNNMLQSGSTTRTTGPFRIHQALQDELNHQFHREQAAAAAAADDPAAADPQLEAAAGRQLLGVRSVFEDAEASAGTSSREFNSTTIWQQDDQAGVHLLQRLPPHVAAAGPRVLRRRSRANRAHLLHINSVAAASPILRSDLNMGTAARTTPSSNSTITLGLLAAGAAAADPSLLEIEARQVLREQQQQQQVDQKSTTAAAAGSTTFCMSSMIGSACRTQETSNTLTSCCSNNNNNNCIGENFECNICFQKANEAVVTCCGHLFCWPCLYSWLHVHSFHKECPVCKGVIAETAITPIYGRDHGHSTTSSSCNPQQQQQQQQQSANNSGAAAAGSTHAQTAGAADTVDDVDATTTTTTRSSHESPRIPPRPQARRVESARQQRGRDERERERERERAAATLIRETEAAAAAARSSLQALSLQTQLPATAADHEIADEYAQAAADQLLNNSFTDPDDQELYNSVLDHHHHQHLAPDRYAPVDSSSSSLQVIRAWTVSNSQSAVAPPPSVAAAAADQMIIAAAAGAHDELIINNNARLMRLDHETRLMTAVAEDLDHDDVDDLLQQQQLHTRSMLQLLPGYIADHVDDMGVAIDHALQEV